MYELIAGAAVAGVVLVVLFLLFAGLGGAFRLLGLGALGHWLTKK